MQMDLSVKVLLISLIIVLSCVAFYKDFKRLTDKEKMPPLTLIFEGLVVVGCIIFFIGIGILDSLLLSNLAIFFIMIGLIFTIVKQWDSIKEISNSRKISGLVLIVCFLAFYIFFTKR